MAYEVVGVPSLHKDGFGIQAKERSDLLKNTYIQFRKQLGSYITFI
jgi:hypothetical protein